MHNSWPVRLLVALLVAFPLLVAGGSGWLAPFPMDVKSHEANLPFGASFKALGKTHRPLASVTGWARKEITKTSHRCCCEP